MDGAVGGKLLALCMLWLYYRRKRSHRKCWAVRYIYRKRLDQGDNHNLIQEMRLSGDEEAL